MTIEEAYQSYGYLTYVSSEGDSLLFVSRRLYGSDSSYYRRILQVLNPRVDWLSLPGGVSVVYLSPDVVSMNSLS
jgi:hypothetical protein|nr:MAG TPA: hypothetical protein [Herelleviridae sp.]